MINEKVQELINNAFEKCEELKDEINLLKFKYEAAMAYLEALRRESKLDVSQNVLERYYPTVN